MKVLNAFLDGPDVVAVLRDGATGARLRRWSAEHSVRVREADLSDGYADKLDRHPSVISIDPEPEDVLRVRFVDRDSARAFCSAASAEGVPTFEGLVSPVLRWMVDEGVEPERPRIAWFDIETDSRVPFAKKERARVLSWVVISPDGDERVGVLVDDSDDAERDLLAAMWDAFADCDLIAAWNGDNFDFPIIRARSRNQGLLTDGLDLRRWLWLDHLECFKRANMMAAESGEEKQSFALDAIAHAVLGVGKHDFDAAYTWEHWAAGGADRQKMVDYMIQDGRLMPAIEEKTGYVELLWTLAEACGTFPDTRGGNPQVQVDGFLSRLAHRRGHLFPTRLGHPTSTRYKGAWVMEPKTSGITRDVHVADFSALYPTIIRSWNMSPETFVRGNEAHHAEAAGEQLATSPLTKAQFLTSEEGLLPAAVSELMRLREHWNDAKAKAAPGTTAWKDADRRSTAYKIAANSFYGVIGAPTSRHFNRDVAEAVTQCGAWLILKTIEFAEREYQLTVVYGDTDSCFIVGCGKRRFEEFVERCNADLYPGLMEGVGCRENLINLAYEKAYDRLIIVTAKRYIGSYSHFKGTPATAESKPEVKGLEYKRGDSVRLARQLQEEAANMLVGYKCDAEDEPRAFELLLARWRRRVLTGELELGDVVLSKRLGKPLEEFTRRLKKDGDPMREPAHVRMARILLKRGRDVRQGAKVDYFLIDGKGKHVEVAPAEDWDGDKLDRETLWQKYVGPPTERLLAAAFPAHNWKPWMKPVVGGRRRRRSEARPSAP